jgi:lycopene cyclase domain-containing protein
LLPGSVAGAATVLPGGDQRRHVFDVTAVFGPYTYLASELFFGAVAVALCYRAGALRRAAVTVAVLYPVGYVWDWYTLEVGVFSIEVRTGVDLLGIPLEEHLFMLVVPAMVVGAHETIHGRET